MRHSANRAGTPRISWATTSWTYANSPATKTGTTNGHWEKTTYDGLGRAIKVETGDGGGTKTIVETQYEACACSPLGKVKKVSQPYAPAGAVNWTVYNYDGLGRVTSVQLPGNTGTTGYVYEGNTVKVTDAAGKWKKYVTDVFGNLTQVKEPDPQSWNLYTYVLGDPVNLNDPEGLDVNVPIKDVGYPTCLSRVFKDVITPSGFGTTNDDRAATNFFSSLEGTFGLSLFFETRPSGNTTDKDSPMYQAALGVGFVYINRYIAQWGAESGFHTLKKVIMDASTPIWNRGAGDSRMMRDEFRDKVYDILNGSPSDSKGDCEGLIWSLHLGQSMVAHSVGVSHSLPRQLSVYNPVGDALAFHSYNNNNVPKGWSKRLRYTRTVWVPRYGGGYSRFNFFYIPGVELPTH